MGAVAAAVIGSALLIAGAGKLAFPARFRGTLIALGVAPRAARVAGLVLPVSEVVSGVALVVLPAANWSAWLGSLLVGVFVAAGSTTALRRIHVQCSCFGLSSSELGWRQALMGLAWLALVWIAHALHGGDSTVRTTFVVAIVAGSVALRSRHVVAAVASSRADRLAFAEVDA